MGFLNNLQKGALSSSTGTFKKNVLMASMSNCVSAGELSSRQPKRTSSATLAIAERNQLKAMMGKSTVQVYIPVTICAARWGNLQAPRSSRCAACVSWKGNEWDWYLFGVGKIPLDEFLRRVFNGFCVHFGHFRFQEDFVDFGPEVLPVFAVPAHAPIVWWKLKVIQLGLTRQWHLRSCRRTSSCGRVCSNPERASRVEMASNPPPWIWSLRLMDRTGRAYQVDHRVRPLSPRSHSAGTYFWRPRLGARFETDLEIVADKKCDPKE